MRNRYAAIFWGAILGSIGDVLIMAAVRESAYANLKLAVGILFYASCGIAWYLILKSGDGSYSSSAAVWSFVGAIISVFIAWYAQDKQTPLQWIGFGLIIAGIMVRSMSGLLK